MDYKTKQKQRIICDEDHCGQQSLNTYYLGPYRKILLTSDLEQGSALDRSDQVPAHHVLAQDRPWPGS